MYAPVELMLNVPPVEPVMFEPTLPAAPLTALTLSASPSGSVSFVPTLPLVEAFSVVEPLSLIAVGAGFVTVHVKVCDVATPLGSVPVIVTEYGPVTLALAAIVPVTMPVVGLMLSPAGRFVALNVSEVLASGSLKFPDTLSVTLALSVLF